MERHPPISTFFTNNRLELRHEFSMVSLCSMETAALFMTGIGNAYPKLDSENYRVIIRFIDAFMKATLRRQRFLSPDG